MNVFQSAYLSLYDSGELQKRAARLTARLASCDICPRQCHVNRLAGEPGVFCHSGKLPIVASYCAHHGEEPALSGSRGSGTIFSGNCNLRCMFCQNYQISQNWQRQKSNEVSVEMLAEDMLYLQAQGCHNINLVSPSHFVPQIVQALLIAVPMGLKLPLVYNTNAYDSLETLTEMDGIVDIYLPDIKYASDEMAVKYSQAPDYVRVNRAAIREIYRQVGDLQMDEQGVAVKGMIIRHLVLPNNLAGTGDILRFIAQEISPRTYISLMGQYFPAHNAHSIPELSRRLTQEEYDQAVEIASQLGLENTWVQELDSD